MMVAPGGGVGAPLVGPADGVGAPLGGPAGGVGAPLGEPPINGGVAQTQPAVLVQGQVPKDLSCAWIWKYLSMCDDQPRRVIFSWFLLIFSRLLCCPI